MYFKFKYVFQVLGEFCLNVDVDFEVLFFNQLVVDVDIVGFGGYFEERVVL